MDFWFGDSASVIHVSKSGNDANGGVAQQYPVSLANDSKLTIGSALSACPDGGTIVIWPGEYAEQVDVASAAKSIRLVGVHRYKCMITQSGSTDTVVGYKRCVFENLSVTQTGMGKALTVSDETTIVNCDVISSGIDGLYGSGADRVKVKNCYVFSSYDSLYLGNEGLVEDSLIVTDGCYSGSGVARAVCTGSAGDNVIVRNSILIAQPSYGKKTMPGAELYESDRDLYCIKTAGTVVLDNCVLIASGYKPGGAHADSYAAGDSHCVDAVQRLVANNCSFFSWTDANQAGTTAYGLHNTGGQVQNGIFSVFGLAGTWELYTTGTRKVYLANTCYDAAKVGSGIELKAVPDAGGGIEVSGKALTAAKMLLNKAVQNKLTGAVEYFDDDGQTVVLTHTPSESESSITREPN